MPPTGDVVWIDVLPSLRQFGQQLQQGVGSAATQAGQRAGQDFGQSFQERAVANVETATEKMQAAMRKVEDAAGRVRVAEQKLNDLRANGRATQSQIVAAEEALARAQRASEAAAEGQATATRRVREAQEAATKATREHEQALKGATEEGGRFEAAMGKVKGAMGGLVIAGAAAGAGVFAAFWGAMNAERDQDLLTAQLGLDPQQALRAGQAAGALFKGAYGESLAEVNTAVGAVMSSIAGMREASAPELQAVTAMAMDIATAFGVEVPEAAALAGFMIERGLAANATEAFDLMTVAFQRVPAAMREELPDIIQEYGVNFQALGFSGEEAFAMLISAAQRGKFDLDKTGDALKEFTIRSTDMSTTSVAAYDRLGLSAHDMANAILSGGPAARDATTTIAQSLLSVEDPAERANLAIALFGTPLEDLSVDQIPAFLESVSTAGAGLDGVGGAAEKLGTTLADNLSTKLESAKRIVMGFATDGLGAVLRGFEEGRSTAGGWLGFMESIGAGIQVVFTEVSGAVSAFAAAWRYNDGQVTSSGLPGFMERVGYYARQTFDFFAATVIPVLGAVVGFFLENEVALWALIGAYAAFRLASVAANAAMFIQTATTYGLSYALTFGSTAAKVYTAAQWLMNASLLGFPLVWIVAALAAVAAAVVLLWQNSETFRSIVTAVWQAIQDAISWAWNNVIRPAWDAMKLAWAALVEAAVAAWNGILRPMWDTLMAMLRSMWENTIRPIFGLIQEAWAVMSRIMMDAWVTIIQPMWAAVQTVLVALWDNILRPYFEFIWTAWQMMASAMALAWATILKPMWDVLMVVARVMFDFLTTVIFIPIEIAWRVLLGAMELAWNTILKPMWAVLSTTAEFLWNNVLSPIFTAIGGAWDLLLRGMNLVWDTVLRPAFDAIRGAVSAVQAAFETAMGGIQAAWDRIRGIVATPINFVIRTVLRDGIFSAWNWVLDQLGVSTWKIDLGASWLQGIAGYATGGRVDGFSPTKDADNVPAWLTAGEWVHSVDTVRTYGRDTMERLNNREIDPKALQYLARGGSVLRFDDLVPGFATSGELYATILKQFPRASKNSGYRPGDPGYHGADQAVDLGESGFAGGAGRPYLAAMSQWITDNFGKSREIIYNGLGDNRMNIKNGAPLAYSAAVQAQHLNHVHWAAGPGALSQYAGTPSGLAAIASSGGASGTAAVVQHPLVALWGTITGGLDWLKGKLGNLAPAGGGVVGGLLKELAGRFPGMMWDKIKDTVAGLFTATDPGGLGTNAVATGGATVDQVKAGVAARGWNVGTEWAALDRLIAKESSWNPAAQNPVSTASGLFQHIDATWRAYRSAAMANTPKMRLAVPGEQTYAGARYIAARYGTPSKALAFHNANNWYASGGEVMPVFHQGGTTRGWPRARAALLDRDERVFSPRQDDYWRRFVDAVSQDGNRGGGGGRRLAEQINVYANDRDQGRDIVEKLWHKVRVADRGGVYTFTV